MSPTIDPIGTVAPGQEVDVSVSFTAPTAPGDYKSYWRLRNSSGVLLPVLGGWLGKGFFVFIKIGSSGYDFYTGHPPQHGSAAQQSNLWRTRYRCKWFRDI